MPDQTPKPASVPPATPTGPASSTPPAPQRGPTIRIGDEFGTAKRNLPPVKVLLIALAGVLVIAGVVAFLQRAKPQAAGSLDNVAAVQIPNQTASLVALTFTLRSSGEKTTLGAQHSSEGHHFQRRANQRCSFRRRFRSLLSSVSHSKRERSAGSCPRRQIATQPGTQAHRNREFSRDPGRL